jgi:molecular chaperone HscB
MVCAHPTSDVFSKCSECGEINLPETTKSFSYFDLFSIKATYFIDLANLQKRFYELSRLLHPDRFQTKSIEALDLSTHWSAVLNKAFNTLKDPEARAYYLFDLAHFHSEGKGALPSDLAEDYFSLQETLEEGSEAGKEDVKKFYSLLKNKLEEIDVERDEIFKDWEMASSPLDERAKNFFAAAAKSLQQKAYLRSMSQDLEKKWPL